MSTITTRAGKGSPLTNNEVDANFTNLNTDKAELSGATFTGDVTSTGFSGDITGAVLFQAKAGEAFTKGDPVYISGISGNTTVVSKADANDANKMPCFGIVNATVSINANCSVVTFGTLSNLNTSAFSEGDELYISDTGTLSSTAPTGETSQLQKIAKVTRAHASAGSIKVMGAGRTNATPNLNDGKFFLGNSSNQSASATFSTSVTDIALPLSGGAMTGAITTNSTFDGRDVATDGTKLDGIEASADVTDTTNVTAAGALMDSELTSIASVKALNQGVATTDSPTFVGLNATGNLTLDVAGSLYLDSDDGLVYLLDGGSTFGEISKSGNDLRMTSFVADGDLVFRGNDDGSYISALTLDMSNAGAATFNAGATFNGTATMDGLSVDGGVEVKANGGNSPLVAKIWNTGTSTNDDAVLGFLTQGNRNYSIGISRETGSFTVSNQNESVDSGERLTVTNNGDISFYEDTGTTPKFFWDASAESLGIGTSSPASPLTINGNDPLITFENGESPHWQIGVENTQSDRFVFYDNNASAYRMVIDSSGNVGIGVVPSAWHASWKALQMGPIGFVGSYQASTTDITALGSNVYSDGTYKYIETDEAVIYKQQNGEHIFDVAPSGSADSAISWNTAMTIDNSGNVGIGTDAPAGILHLDEGAADDCRLIAETHAGGDSMILFTQGASGAGTPTWGAGLDATGDVFSIGYEASGYNSFSLSADSKLVIDTSGNVGIGVTNVGAPLDIGSTNPKIRLTDTGGGYSELRGNGGVMTLTADAGNNVANSAVTFETDGTERMRINSAAQVLVGTQSKISADQGDGGLAVHGDTQASGSVMEVKNTGNPSSGRDLIRFYNTSNGEAGSIEHTGTSTVSYLTSSDYRLKENVVTLTGASKRLKQIPVKRFNFIADGPDVSVDGFLAHEVQAVVPEAVSGEKDAMQTEEYEVTPAVYEDVVIPATEEVLDEEGNVITEAQEESTEQQLVSEAVMGEREVPDYQGIDQSKLVPLLVATIQELEARISALEE